jgi:hypothetical protein
MLIFKVRLDLSLVINRLVRFDLREYNSTEPILFIEATDPDGACFKAIFNLIQIILKQDDSIESRLLCRSIREDIRVIKVSCQ